MKRRWGFLAVLILALAPALAGAVPVSAAIDDYHWDSSYGGYVDRQCGSTHYFEVDVYEDASYGGQHTKVCGPESDFCLVPLKHVATGSSCWAWGYMLNDMATSFRVRYIASCRRLYFYRDTGYNGASYQAVGSVANVGSTWNDTFSSIRPIVWC